MDTKLKKSNKAVFTVIFIICVLGFIAFIASMMIADALMGGRGLGIWELYFPNDYFGEYYERLWQENGAELLALRGQISILLAIIIGSGLLTLSTFIYLMVAIGEKDETGKIITKGVDKIYTEIQLFIIAIALTVGGGLFLNFSSSMVMHTVTADGIIASSRVFYEPAGVVIVFICLIGVISAGIGLYMTLSCVRKIKARSFLSQSIIGKICIAVYNALFMSGSLTRKVVIVAIAICVLSATVALAPVILIAIIVLAPKWIKKFEAIVHGVDEVKSGNLSYKIPVTGDGELDRLAQGINEISQASNVAVQNELKNQRMKTELISNVSHDLKTPLTSMVTYIDLLKTEGLGSENAPEYLEVLDQKTNRLRQLTEDLFEAAKASSGAIPVKRERVDMLSLINQGLGEMDQRIRDSKLEFIIKAQEEKYYVWADGQLLWRVVENLLGNALKYAQEGTRVYIDIKEQGATDRPSTMVVLEMKNISKQALNIEADELMERFKRGDESRTTDGSGLGLAIAKDLVKLQEGWFDIKIDGDLFKATVMLEKANKEAGGE